MARLLVENDLLELKFYCHCEGQYSINTRHYAVGTVQGLPKDSDAAEAMAGTFPALLKQMMSLRAEYLGLSVQIIRPTRRPKIVSLIGADVGELEGDTLPRQVAGLIRFHTDVASRSGRGRMFVPFPAESVNTATGFPQDAYLTGLLAFGTQFTEPFALVVGGQTTFLTPIVFNRANNTGIEINGCTVADVWSTCRRRADIRGGDRPTL